jgi:hypothetical protein
MRVPVFDPAPMSFPQLCAIALERWNRRTPADFGEWSEAVKGRCARLGFAYDATQITRAMAAVQRAHRLTFAAAAEQATTAIERPSEHRELTPDECRAMLREIERRYRARRPLDSAPELR